ncbi:MAG: ABC transporter ATP-binding protein [Aigarchaeota archaeon]|nr:ABC transporter ATP-binding protein [Candidatus Pelearchaeum maunauluense]
MLILRNVVKQVGRFRLGPVSLEVGDETLVVLGVNGAGKTTLLNLIAGILEPDDGEIILNGQLLNGEPIERRGVGYIFQRPYLFPHMSVKENIEYGLRRGEENNIEKFHYVVSLLGIENILNRDVRGLSGGEAQKVALARTLVSTPKILLLDEPLVHLDAVARRELLHELKHVLKVLKIPKIYVTHEAREARVVADRIAVLDSGKVVEEGSREELLKNPKTSYLRRFLEEE